MSIFYSMQEQVPRFAGEYGHGIAPPCEVELRSQVQLWNEEGSWSFADRCGAGRTGVSKLELGNEGRGRTGRRAMLSNVRTGRRRAATDSDSVPDQGLKALATGGHRSAMDLPDR
jgi:hypothetical protein